MGSSPLPQVSSKELLGDFWVEQLANGAVSSSGAGAFETLRLLQVTLMYSLAPSQT